MSSMQVPLLAPVALATDLPEHGLTRGQMGTVVERLADGERAALLVEFSGEDGETLALVPVEPERVIVLHRQVHAA